VSSERKRVRRYSQGSRQSHLFARREKKVRNWGFILSLEEVNRFP
jgi:hypothetical protein